MKYTCTHCYIFPKGITLYLEATSHLVCPFTGALPYLALRGSHSGPLFFTKERQGLTHQSFSALLMSYLQTFSSAQVTTQFLHWRSYNGSSSRHLRPMHQDVGPLEEQCLPKIYPDTSSRVGQAFPTS